MRPALSRLLLGLALAALAPRAAAQASAGTSVETPSTYASPAGGAAAPAGRSGGGGSVRGREGASGVFTSRASRIPDVHVVSEGETLWDLSSYYYGNAYEWPRLWSYNPQIQNPHRIHPGDEIRMRATGLVAGHGTPVAREGGLVDRRAVVPRNTVFLRNQGYIDDPKQDTWGRLVGSREEQQLLGEGNRVYLVMREGVNLKPGQLVMLFRPVRTPDRVRGARRPPGVIVSVKGTVRIEQWNPEKRVARGTIVESLDVIERGDLVGPIGRRLDVVPPRRNDTDVWARVLTGFYPNHFYANAQVVFIDRGADDGLEPGNRLFVVRRGDSWRRSLRTSSHMARDRINTDDPRPGVIEPTPLLGDESAFPQEIIGELRVLRVRKKSALTMVVVSHREIEPGDRAVAKRGY